MRHNTPRTEARQPGRRRKQRYPEGGTSKTWAKAQGAKEDHPKGRGGHVRQGTNKQKQNHNTRHQHLR